MHDLLENTFPEKQSAVIAESLLGLAENTAVRAEAPDLDHCVKNLRSAIEDEDLPRAESALLDLYVILHGAGRGYSAYEKKLLARRKGYSCHPGGLSPLVKAVEFISPDSVVADLGAGNGLQGLLLQRICPHRKTIQIEISSGLIRIGRIFQKALGISDDRIEWIHDDIVNASFEEADFIYIYLPAKPIDGGKEVYESIAGKINTMKRPPVIFSVADCLARFIDRQFSIFYTDGHLTCFVKE
jgi:hypothetical protein